MFSTQEKVGQRWKPGGHSERPSRTDDHISAARAPASQQVPVLRAHQHESVRILDIDREPELATPLDGQLPQYSFDNPAPLASGLGLSLGCSREFPSNRPPDLQISRVPLFTCAPELPLRVCCRTVLLPPLR